MLLDNLNNKFAGIYRQNSQVSHNILYTYVQKAHMGTYHKY